MAAPPRIALMVLAAGCGRVGFGLSADPAPDDGPPIPDAPLGPWGPPAKLSVSSAALDDDPTLTGDMLEIVFESERAGGAGLGDLWHASRPARDAPWSIPQPIVELNTPAGEEHPGISPDGLTLFFASNRAGGLGSFDIYFATRPDRLPSTPWSAPQLAAALNTGGNDEAPQIDASGLVIVLASGPNANERILISTRTAGNATWPTPVVITELDAPAGDSGPMLDESKLSIYFSSSRNGNNDLFVATRAATDLPFDEPILISELCSASTGETDPWVSPDGRTIVFVSDLEGQRDIFEATR